MFTDADYADDIALMSNTINDAISLLHYVEYTTRKVGLHINTAKTEFISYHQDGEIKSLDRKAIKPVQDFVYLGSQIASTEQDVKHGIGKAYGRKTI